MKTIHCAVYDTISDWEVGYATAHIGNGYWQREPGNAVVQYVAATEQPVTSAGGMRIVPDVSVDAVAPTDSAMLILPGAATWDTGGNSEFAELARRFVDAGVTVAAICGATAGLAAGGLLDDRPHTSNAREYLAATGYRGGANYRDDVAAINGDGVITASGVFPVDFAREVLGALDLYEPRVLEAWYKLYGQGDPAGFFELSA